MGRKKFFGEYLIAKGLISDADVLEALILQRNETTSFEKMVCNLGIMDMSLAFKVLTLQAETDLSFMEVAVRHGFINDTQAELTRACIESEKPAIGEVLIRMNKLDKGVMEKELALFERSVRVYDDIKGLLLQIKLFKDLDEVALRSLANITSVTEYDGDQYVIREGEPANNLFAVFSGSLMITKENSGGEQGSIYVGNIQAQEVFGESAVFKGGQRTANVVTCGKTTLLEMERKEFQKFLTDYPAKSQSILLFLVNQLIDKLSDSNHELVQIRNQLYTMQDHRNEE
ncbi:MAG: cyclic nucleotide-binding domain-containing protein [Sedimenticola sp.]